MNEIYRIFPDWMRTENDSMKKNSRHKLLNGKIVWNISDHTSLPHYDHIEFAAESAAAILSYGADKDGTARIFLHAIYPQLRLNPNNTYGSFFVNFENAYNISAEENSSSEILVRVEIDEFGITLVTHTKNLEIQRTYVASKRTMAITEKVSIKNIKGKVLDVKICNLNGLRYSDPKKGFQNKVYRYGCKLMLDGEERTAIIAQLKTDKSLDFYAVYFAESNRGIYNPEKDIADRAEFVKKMRECFTVITPDETINKLCEMGKIRSHESIFKTKNGYMHSPGSGLYYAGVWTNDQGEYVMPLFGYSGYPLAEKCTENTFALFEKYMYRDMCIPSSLIAEGEDYFMYGDRGDCEMLAEGMCNYLLLRCDREKAERYLKALRFCCDFALSKRAEDGVIESDMDELEGRLKHGKSNLAVNSVAYDLFEMQSRLEKALGNTDKSQYYKERAKDLRAAIESHFGADVEGFQTYRYCEDEDRLRAWICYPLMYGIDDRAQESIKALLSDKLFNGIGLYSRAGEQVYWDRSTVSAFRAICYVGHPDEVYQNIVDFSQARLLGEHVPYVIEAYPEGNQAHLAAENAMYLRIFTEGMFGLKAISFNDCEFKINLPSAWEFAELKNLHICGGKFTVHVERADGGKLKVTISGDSTRQFVINENQSFNLINDKHNKERN